MADKIDAFLERITQLESSGGKNLKHKTVTAEGSNKGETAVGRFGIMPNTATDILKRAKLPEAALSKEELQVKLATDPKFERKVARVLASYLLEKHGNDPEKAAFSWRMGHNIETPELTDKKLESSDYVQEFKKLPDPREVDYRDNPQVNPMPKQKSLIERAKESVGGFVDKVSALPEEARREHVARVAAIFAKTDPSLNQEDAMRQAERSLELSEQGGMMAGSLKDLGRFKAREAVKQFREGTSSSVSDLMKKVKEAFETRNTGGIDHPETIAKLADKAEDAGTVMKQVELPPNPQRLTRELVQEAPVESSGVSYQELPWKEQPKHSVGEAMQRLANIQALRRISGK